MAVRAFFCDYLSLAVAFRAYRLHLLGSEECLAHLGDVACASAACAGLECSPVFGSRAVAVGASHELRYLQFLIHSVGDILECHLYGDTQVGAFVYGFAGPAASAVAPVCASALEGVAEDISEIGEDILHRESASEASEASIASRATAPPNPCGPILWP